MWTKLLETIRKSPVYFGLIMLMLSLFAWAEWSGKRIIGDDKYETEKHGYGSGHGGSGYRGRSSFYHK